ncbi:MAG: hypothetical protein ACI9BO_000038 [Zhongshania sp.]|jgi:hypothetical protein
MNKIIWIAMVLMLSACAGIPVSTDYARDYDFSQIKTYAWLPPIKSNDPELDNDLVSQRYIDAIDSQLVAKGIRLIADPAKASVLVTYHLGKEDKITIDDFGSWYTQFGYYPCYYCDSSRVYGYGHFGRDNFYDNNVWVRNYEETSLSVDIIDASSKKLLWRGSRKWAMPNLPSPEERRRYTNETVAAVLTEFPPRQFRGH